MGRPVWSSKRDRDTELTTGHGEHVRGVVHHLIECHERKTKRHELDDRPQSDHGGADAQAGKTVLADRGIDDPLRTEALQQTLRNFVSAVVFRDLLAHEEHVGIAFKFLGQRFVERLAIGDFAHFAGHGA